MTAAAPDHAAFRRNRLNAENVIDSNSVERANKAKNRLPLFRGALWANRACASPRWSAHRALQIARTKPLALKTKESILLSAIWLFRPNAAWSMQTFVGPPTNVRMDFVCLDFFE